MAIDREAAYAALAARLQARVGPQLNIPISRKLRAWADVEPADQPCAFVVATHQVPLVDGPAVPAPWQLNATVVIYARADADPAASAETTLNGLVRAVEDALTPQPGDTTHYAWTNLAGAVAWAMPGGPVEFESGAQGGQGVAYFPIAMIPVPT